MAEKKKALIFVNQGKSEAKNLLDEICGELEKSGFESLVVSFDGKPSFAVQGDFDIGFSLGGDGTVLCATRTMAPMGIPVMPVNFGTLGFIAAVPPEGWKNTFARWKAGQAALSQRLMLTVEIERRGAVIFRSQCLNDSVISASGIAKLIRLEVQTETRSGECIQLGRFRSDGLIVATPTGSTGYSVAAGGPIIDPEMEVVIINPICPFTLSNRPMVVPSCERVITLVEDEQRSSVLLTVDGQITESLEPGDLVITKQAPYKAMLIESDREVFYRAIRTKLSWSGGSDHAGYQGGHDA